MTKKTKNKYNHYTEDFRREAVRRSDDPIMNKYLPNTEDVYSLMGATLSYIQLVEKILRLVTTFVIQDDEELNLQKLQSLEKKEAKKALGYFMVKLRERAELYPSFDDLLASFLMNRNDFVHNHDSIPGWDLNTEKGREVARNFTSNLLHQAHKINEVFIALVMRWQKETGLKTPKEQGQQFFQEIEAQYDHLIDTLFTAKET